MGINKSKASEIHGVRGVCYHTDGKYYNHKWEEVVRLEGEIWVAKPIAIEMAKQKQRERVEERLKKETDESSTELDVFKLKHEINELEGDLAYFIGSIDIIRNELKIFKNSCEAVFDSMSKIKVNTCSPKE